MAPSFAKAAIACHKAGGGGPHGMVSSDLIIVMKRMVFLLFAVAGRSGRHHPHVDRQSAFSTADVKDSPDKIVGAHCRERGGSRDVHVTANQRTPPPERTPS